MQTSIINAPPKVSDALWDLSLQVYCPDMELTGYDIDTFQISAVSGQGNRLG